MFFIYVFNIKELCKYFWDKIYVCYSYVNGFWIIVGDFNFLIEFNDRIGGN